jgi:DNA repair protein RadA/Sms
MQASARTPYGMRRRSAVGFDYNWVYMLLAILEKRMGMDFGTLDVYVNVVGGIKVSEPAADLAVVAALVSSYRNKPLPMGTLVVGEVGLTGEVRRVGLVDRRIKEAPASPFTGL